MPRNWTSQTAIAWRTLWLECSRVTRAHARSQSLQSAKERLSSIMISPPQAPLMVSRPAAGAAHGVHGARAPDLPDNMNRAHLRAHALAGGTAVEQAQQ